MKRPVTFHSYEQERKGSIYLVWHLFLERFIEAALISMSYGR